MITLQDLRRRPHVSVSQLKTYLQCPRRYFLQYVHRIPPAHRPVALPFGSAWHEAIGTWLANSVVGDEVGRDVLKQVFTEHFERDLEENDTPVLFDDEDDTAGSATALAHKMLDIFLTTVPLPERVLGVEVPFSMELVDPTTGEVLPVPLVGAVDAILEEHGRPIVWELKTAAKKWSVDQLEYDQQATAYTRAMRLEGHHDVSVKMLVTTKTVAPVVQVEALTRSRADEDELSATAASVLRAIEAGVDHPVRGWACRGCAWASECRT